MATYRTLFQDEIPTAVKLWVDVFGIEAPFFQTLLDGDEPDGVSVGAFEGDSLVSSVHVFIRWFRDREGNPQKVGAIGSVSTLPDARAQGHSSRLLQLAIQEMTARDCIWSYLGTGVNDHYAKQGWRTVSTANFRGVLDPSTTAEFLEPAKVTESLLDDMAGVFLTYSTKIPMTNARTRSMWQTAIRYRVSGASDEVFTVYKGDELRAYLVTRGSESNLELVEGAFVEGAEAEFKDLVRKRVALAGSKGGRKATCLLPEASVGFAVFKEECNEVLPAEDRAWMVRPIADRITWSDLVAILADPRGRRSELDNF
jgi:GNAT superfamily N-acetyltransferase